MPPFGQEATFLPTLLKLPVLVVTPHSSGFAPLDVLAQMLGARAVDRHAREAQLTRLFVNADPFTDAIFHSARARMWHAGISPLVVDVGLERNEDVGMLGVLPATDFWLRPLYPAGFELTPAEAEERLRRYWDPFHEEIERTIVTHGVRLLVSGHSMRRVGPPASVDEGRRRPALVLTTGGDPAGEAVRGRPVTVDPSRARALHRLLELHFGPVVMASPDVPREIALNHPWNADALSVRYSGVLRPRPIPAFGLEINRALYLHGQGEHDLPDDARLFALNVAFDRFLRDAARMFELDVA
jgi:hypothetical protein